MSNLHNSSFGGKNYAHAIQLDLLESTHLCERWQ